MRFSSLYFGRKAKTTTADPAPVSLPSCEEFYCKELRSRCIRNASGSYVFVERKLLIATMFGDVKIYEIADPTMRLSGWYVAIKSYQKSRVQAQQSRTGHSTFEDPYQEFATLRELDGYNGILPLLDTFETPTMMFAVFNYLPGGDLFDFFQSHANPLPERTIKSIFRGISHRDVSLENFLVSEDKAPVLIDFGLSIKLQFDAKLGRFPKIPYPGLFGKFPYMAPEALKRTGNGYVDVFKQDVWSLGVCLLRMMFLEDFWQQASKRDKQFKRYILQGKLFTVLKSAGVPYQCIALFQGMLALEIDNRWTMDQVLQHPWLT